MNTSSLLLRPSPRWLGRAALVASLLAGATGLAGAQPQPGHASGPAGHAADHAARHTTRHAAAHGGPALGGMGQLLSGGGPRVERLLDAVAATPEQRAQLKAIGEAARADLRARQADGRALHAQGLALFAQPTVDARAAEQLRRQMLARHDQASQRMLQAMLEASRVLTLEQRTQLVEMARQRHARMERGADGGGAGRPQR